MSSIEIKNYLAIVDYCQGDSILKDRVITHEDKDFVVAHIKRCLRYEMPKNVNLAMYKLLRTLMNNDKNSLLRRR